MKTHLARSLASIRASEIAACEFLRNGRAVSLRDKNKVSKVSARADFCPSLALAAQIEKLDLFVMSAHSGHFYCVGLRPFLPIHCPSGDSRTGSFCIGLRPKIVSC
jgi:hypothetical protein